MHKDENGVWRIGTKAEIEEVFKVAYNLAIDAALTECIKRDTFESYLLYSRIKELKK